MMNPDAIGPTGSGHVRIDSTHGLAPGTAPQEAQAEALPGPRAGRAPENSAEVISSHQRLIAAASAGEEVNAQAVAQARALLEAGLLDTPEAARRTAEVLLEIGL